MCIAMITLFVVPTLYCLVAELRLRLRGQAAASQPDMTQSPRSVP